MFFIGSFSWQKHLKSKEKVRPTSLSYISYFSHPQAKSPPRVLRDKDQSGVIRQPQRPEPYTVRKQPFPEKKKASHPIAEQVAGLAQMASSSPSSLLPIFLHHLFLPIFLSNFYPPQKKLPPIPLPSFSTVAYLLQYSNVMSVKASYRHSHVVAIPRCKILSSSTFLHS